MYCQSCGFENPAGFAFCGACGARLGVADAGAGKVERKVISALFCDVVESTARAERVDPEDVKNVLAPYYDGVRTHLERMGGTVEKFIGDAVCGLFGAPRTRGDDPERAVRAALAVRDWIADVNEADSRLELHLRLGVATGEAVVALAARAAQGEAMAWGDVMNTAARLQSAAPVDSILVDEPTYRATRHAIEYDEAEPVSAKGKAEPVRVWQALAPRARRGVDLAQQGREPFVDRTEQLALLRECLGRVGERRAPELVALVGESGIGKSRLAFELFRWAEHQTDVIHWRQAGTSPYGDVLTYGALGEIMKGQVGILETDGADAAAEKLGEAVATLVTEPAEAARIEAHLRSLVGLEAPTVTQGDQRQAAFVAWRRFLEAVAHEYPLVLVFDDIQWADAGLLDFIEHVLDWSRGVGTLVLCTARPEFVDTRPEWWTRDDVTMVPLTPLPNANMAELVSLLAPDAIPSHTREAVVGAASGNPLFAVEFARMLVDRIERPPTAESVRGIIASRLDALPADDKLLLQDAAVVGNAVWPGVLATAGDRARESVEQQLRELVRREFLTRVTPSSVEGEPEFKFRHDLVRDVAYEQIPRARRAEVHRRTAEWLDSLSPDRAKDRGEMLALHYVSAYEYALASGVDTEGLVEGVRLSLRSAGDHALTLNAFATAEQHYRGALALWPDDDPERGWLLFKLGKACYYANREDEELFVEAERLLLEAGDLESAAEAAAFQADLAHALRRPQETVFEHAFRALDLVAGREASRSKAEVLLDAAVFHTLVADQERAIELATEAQQCAEALGLAELEARALATLGAAKGASGDPAGRDDLRRSVEITEEIGSPLGSHHCGMLADLECSLGHLAECFELQAQAREHAERFGHVAHIQWLKAERVAECYWTGQWDEAVAVADAFLAETEAGSRHFMEPYCHATRARIRLARGELAGALDDTLDAVVKARDSEEPQMLCPALAVRARALVAAGALDDAAQAVDELLALWAEKLNLFLTSAWVVDLAWALEGLGRGAELREIAEGVRARTAWLEAAIASTSGGFAVAAGLLADIGSRPDEALACLRSAQVFAGAGHEAVARAYLEHAQAFFASVGALAYLSEADAALVG